MNKVVLKNAFHGFGKLSSVLFYCEIIEGGVVGIGDFVLIENLKIGEIQDIEESYVNSKNTNFVLFRIELEDNTNFNIFSNYGKELLIQPAGSTRPAEPTSSKEEE